MVSVCLHGYTHWQYGSGSLAGATQNILELEILTAKSDNSLYIDVQHRVPHNLSKWVIGKIGTKCVKIPHVARNVVEFFADSVYDSFFFFNYDLLRCIPLDLCASAVGEETALSWQDGNVNNRYSWNRRKATIDKVYLHVCIHANFTGMRVLSPCSILCSAMVSYYYGRLLELGVACWSSASV